MRCPTLSELPSCLQSNEVEQMCATHPQTKSIHQRYLAQIKAILASVFKDKECAMYLFGSKLQARMRPSLTLTSPFWLLRI